MKTFKHSNHLFIVPQIYKNQKRYIIACLKCKDDFTINISENFLNKHPLRPKGNYAFFNDDMASITVCNGNKQPATLPSVCSISDNDYVVRDILK